MKLLTAIIILASLYGSIIIAGIIVFNMMRKNNVTIQVSEKRDNAFYVRSYRGRFHKGKFYLMRDFFKRKPQQIEYEKVKKYIMFVEGIPLIGVKRILEMKKIDGKLFPWKHKKVETKPLISDILVSWTQSTRKDLYENTKKELTKAELAIKFIVPMGIILLAICCLIFFPKIYTQVISQGNHVAESAINGFTKVVNKFVPVG